MPLIKQYSLEYSPIFQASPEYLTAIWSDKDVIKYTNIKQPCTLKEITERLKNFINHDVFIIKQNKETIGIAGCPCINKEKNQYGFFYQLKKSAWGRGIGSEAALWCVNYMKKKYGTFTLYADVVSENIASYKILKSLGFKETSVEKEAFQLNGLKIDIKNYSLKINGQSLKETIYHLENELLKSDVRKSAEKISELLSEDFQEVTSSGQLYFYKKGDVYQDANDNTELNWEITEFQIKELTEECVLAIYKVIKHNETDESKKYTYRSSIWKCFEGKWKMAFHQGTLLPYVKKTTSKKQYLGSCRLK